MTWSLLEVFSPGYYYNKKHENKSQNIHKNSEKLQLKKFTTCAGPNSKLFVEKKPALPSYHLILYIILINNITI